MDIEGMESQMATTRKLAADSKFSRIYGLASSRELGHSITELETLDVDLAIMIAVNWDEEAISLDYRNNMQCPTVMLSWWPESTPRAASHKVIAVDLEEFARLIGLPILP
jgi:hypothetical protein